MCEPSGDPDTRMVPMSLVTASCYAFQPNESAACWDPNASEMTEATWMNAVGLYPPLFYAAMGLFASDDVPTSVLVMRLFNSALIVGLVTAVFFALPRRVRPALVISVLASAVPLGMFVIASTNPSSWAIAAAMTVWICLYGATQTTGRRQVVLAGLAVVGTIMGTGARADASLFAVFGVTLAAILGARRGRALLVPGIAAIIVVAISVTMYLSAGQSSSLTSGLPTDSPPLTSSQHLANLLDVPILWFGAFGGSGLGWLDTVLPATVTILSFATFCAAVFIGIHRMPARRAVAVTAAFAALWLVPFVMLAQSHAVVGTIVQSRYLLPIIILLLGVASLTPRAIPSWRGARSFVAGVALSVAMSLALHDNIRRYTFGAEDNAIDPGLSAEWWWSVGPSPLVVWLWGSLAFTGVFVILWMLLRYMDDELSSGAEREADAPELVRTAPTDHVGSSGGHTDRLSPASPAQTAE